MRSHKQPTATRKPPAMSVEEELAELLADPTLRPSITFLGLSADTETISDTSSVPGTTSVSDTVSVPVKSSVFGVPKLGLTPARPDPAPLKPRVTTAPRRLKVKG